MHQQISLDQNMLFQETSVNKTLDAWVELVGDGHAPSWGVAEACPFQGSPPRGPGLEGEDWKGPLGQHPDFRVRAQVPSPFSRP